MLNSSEGRWRKRLHLPGHNSRHHSSGGSHQYEERRLVQGLDASLMSQSTTSSASPPQRHAARMVLNSNPNSGSGNNSRSLSASSKNTPEDMSQQRLSVPRTTSFSDPVHTDDQGSTPAWLLDHPPLLDAGALPSNSSSHPSGAVANAAAQPRGGAAAIASLILISLVTYVLYHASMEALVDETGNAWAPHAGFVLEQHSSAGTRVGQGGAGGGADGGAAAPRENPWGPGVSVITVSAWQSIAALCAGFVMSRARRTSAWRRVETRPLGEAEGTRRNRCLFAFAAAHLLGTGLEYHSYGVVGPVAAEILRATETAIFCAFSLHFFGKQRRGFAFLPTLLLAFGLALGAAPAVGDFGVGAAGLEFSLGSSFFLAVRAVAAKMALDDSGLDEVSALFSGIKMTAVLQLIVLLAVEVPRAATGLPPRLLPHLWGVGIAGHGSHSFDYTDRGMEANGGGSIAGGGSWVATEDRARLALLLLANGLCLYGHVLALFSLLSRLSAPVFAIVSGYIRAALVFVLLLSLSGSATYPRSAGMLLSTIGVVAHFYRTYAGRHKSSANMAGRQAGLLDDGDENGQGTRDILPLPQLPTFLREGTPSPASKSMEGEGGDNSLLSQGARRSGGGQPQALFVPLLGTRHDIENTTDLEEGRLRKEAWGHGASLPSASYRSDSGAASNSDEEGVGSHSSGNGSSISHRAERGSESGTSPSRFAWRWMGLRHGAGGTAAAGSSDRSSSMKLPPPSPPSAQRPRDAGSNSFRFSKQRSDQQSGAARHSSPPTSSANSIVSNPVSAASAYAENAGSYATALGHHIAPTGSYDASTAEVCRDSRIGRHLSGAVKSGATNAGAFVSAPFSAAPAYFERPGTGSVEHEPSSYRADRGIVEKHGDGTSVNRAHVASGRSGETAGGNTSAGSSSSLGRKSCGSDAIAYGDSGAVAYGASSVVGGGGVTRGGSKAVAGVGGAGSELGGGIAARRSSALSIRSPSPSSSSSFSLNGFEVIDKEEDMWS